MFEALGQFIVHRRALVLAGLLLVTAAAAAVLPGLRFDFTPQALFEQHDEVNDFAASIRGEFGDDTNTLLVIWRTDDVFAPETLADVHTVTEELEAWEHAVRVLSVTNTRLPRNEVDAETGESVLDMGPLVDELPVPPTEAERLRELVMNEPLLERMVVSRDGTMTAIAIELPDEARRINALIPVVEDLQSRMETWRSELPSEPDLVLSGLPQVRVDIVTTLQTEQARFLPLTALLILILMGWMFRKASGVLLPMGSIGLALFWALAFMVLIGHPINVINSVLPTLLMIIGLSDGIHLLSRAAEESADPNASREAIIVATVKRIGLACLLTSMTTAIGFGSLVMSSTDILRDFGLDTAVGVLLAYVSTILFIPVMLTFMEPPRRSGLHSDKPGMIERFMVRNAAIVKRRPWTTIGVSTFIATLAIISSVVWGRIDTRLLEVYPDDHPTAELTREVNDQFAGVLPLVVSIEAEEAGFFEDPENLAKLAELQRVIEEADPEFVLKTGSVHDMLQVFRAAYTGNPEDRHAAFESAAQITTILRLYRRDAEDDVNRLLDPENRHALITVRLDDLGMQRGQQTIGLVADEAERLFGEGAADGVVDATPPTTESPVRVRLAGDVYLASVGLDNFITDLLASLGLASVLIFLAMTFLFRSIRLGVLSVAPNALPLLMTFGWMAFRGIELNTSTVVIFSISLGLAVDDTIHFLTRYQEERRDGHGVDDALDRTFLGAGRAIVITSIVLVGGLVILLTTSFNPTRYFAELTACTVVGAIVGDLFLLPALLLVFDRRPRHGLPADPAPG